MREINFNYLLAGQITLIVAVPVLHEYGKWARFELLEIAFSTALILAVASLAGNVRAFLAGLVVALLALIFAVAAFFSDMALFSHLMMGATLVFFLQAVVYSGRQVFLAGTVNLNKLVGAVCIFLLLALCWAILYQFLFTLNPGSFSGVGSKSGQTDFPMFVYFSLVTLTTLGYGDIAPVTPLAGILATLEAVIGVFYIAILVAALVGDFMAARQTRN